MSTSSGSSFTISPVTPSRHRPTKSSTPHLCIHPPTPASVEPTEWVLEVVNDSKSPNLPLILNHPHPHPSNPTKTKSITHAYGFRITRTTTRQLASMIKTNTGHIDDLKAQLENIARVYGNIETKLEHTQLSPGTRGQRALLKQLEVLQRRHRAVVEEINIAVREGWQFWCEVARRPHVSMDEMEGLVADALPLDDF